MSKLFDLDDYNRNTKDYIGVTVFWTVPECLVPLNRVQEVLEQHGLEPSIIAPVKAKVAFKRAGKSIVKNESDGVVRLCRSVVDDTSKSVLAIVTENKNESKLKLDYQQDVTVELNKQSKSIVFRGEGKDEFTDKFNKFCQNVNDDDIRVMIKEFVRACGGCALRDSGGIYFVPSIKVGTLTRLERAIHDLGCGRVIMMRVSASEVEKQVAWESAEAEIEEKIRQITDAVSNIEKRKPFVTRQSDKLAQVERMTNYYMELCSAQTVASGILDKLSKAEQLIADKIAEIDSLVTVE